jgi:O-acetyl-ADP-ribose deacetylase (regulator of RNase III)
MTKITYLIGDATEPDYVGNKILPHICNDLGYWAKGYVLALSNRWEAPERSYRALKTEDRVLGNVQLVPVEYDCEGGDIIVANMIAQKGIGRNNEGIPPIRYDAVRDCLIKVNEEALAIDATLHMPRIGTGLSGGDWDVIESIIQDVVTVDVFIYDLK